MLNNIYLSISLGIVFALFIFYTFIRKISYHGVNSNDIIKRTYIVDNKCYKLVPKIFLC